MEYIDIALDLLSKGYRQMSITSESWLRIKSSISAQVFRTHIMGQDGDPHKTAFKIWKHLPEEPNPDNLTLCMIWVLFRFKQLIKGLFQ